MSYGLDLSGGVHFLLEVDMDKAIGDRMKSEEDNIRRILREARLRYVPANNMVDGTRISLAFYDAPVRDEAQKAIQKEYRDFQILARDVDGNPGLWLTMKDAKIKEIQSYAVQQNLQSLRNRVNELGVSEPLVQSLGQHAHRRRPARRARQRRCKTHPEQIREPRIPARREARTNGHRKPKRIRTKAARSCRATQHRHRRSRDGCDTGLRPAEQPAAGQHHARRCGRRSDARCDERQRRQSDGDPVQGTEAAFAHRRSKTAKRSCRTTASKKNA